jgi:cytochrome P450
MPARRSVPALELDLYADSVLRDSREVFARIRDAGPVVWLPRHGIYAMGRFEDVRAALRNDELFLSGKGVAANPATNLLGRGTTLFSDGEAHSRRRRVLMRSLGAKALESIQEPLAREAARVVDELLHRERFEATADFATRLPVSVISNLVGVATGADQMLRWAAATFEGLGPLNRRSRMALRQSLGLLTYSLRLRPGAVAPNTWAASVFEAERAGELSRREARALIIDFVAPALDTTILATTHLLWVLARNPQAWSQVRQTPALIPTAALENVRLASPIRGFTRTLARDAIIGGTELPKNSRIAILYGAANLDETRFPEPDRFDLNRPDGNHLGWGNGAHTCVGIHLAKLEMRLLLEAMAAGVDAISTGPPEPLYNNTLQGIARLPAAFEGT